MTKKNDVATLTTEVDDAWVEIDWDIPYMWSRPRPATLENPEEGGAELDGDVVPSEITFYPSKISIPVNCPKMATLLKKHYGPDDDDCWDAVQDEEEKRRY